MIWLLARISLLEYISHLSNYIQWMPFIDNETCFLCMTFICTESNFFQCLHEMSNTLCTIRTCCVWKANFYEKNRYQALRKRVICQKSGESIKDMRTVWAAHLSYSDWFHDVRLPFSMAECNFIELLEIFNWSKYWFILNYD